MLMPIIAAVGSFVVSERILKPKATALFVLVCLAVYDVFISPPIPIAQHSNDSDGSDDNAAAAPTKGTNNELDEFWDYDRHHYAAIEEDDLATSLRCYRGPALITVALFCAAYSLRIWRRNGVACDELIFLPGTPHEFRCSTSGIGSGGEQEKAHLSREGSREDIVENGEGGIDSATNNHGGEVIVGHTAEAEEETVSPIKSCFSEGDAAGGAAKSTLQPAQHRPLSRSLDSFETLDVMSARLETAANVDSSGDEADVERMPLMIESVESHSGPNSPSKPRSRPRDRDSRAFTFIRESALKGLDMLVVRRHPHPPSSSSPAESNGLSSPGGESSTDAAASANNNNEVYDAEYAPSGPSVLGAALDLSLPVLFNFHMFVVLMKAHYKREAEGDIEEEDADDTGADDSKANDGKANIIDDTWMKPPQVPPKVLPLFFITPLILRSMVPPRSRRRFFKTMLQGTILSPFKPVRFRDAFVADCVTSLVRPIVDLVYALAYYFMAIFGMLLGKYDLNRAGYLLSKSMIWHGLIMPALSILPLFIKFLQTLRQAYDTGKRWPYLGNAFKYFTAGLVIAHGMTHAEGERSFWWLAGFVLATLYQIAWDSIIDWELLVFVPREPWRKTHSPRTTIAGACRAGRDALPRVRLRPRRLFDDDSFYWKALFANAALRFCWMMGFIPAYWVSVYTGSTQVTFVDKAHGWSFVLVATLEIVRRSIWGIIKVELETIKLTSGDENDLAEASTADEYLREGKWKVSRDVLERKDSSACKLGVVENKWRFRLGRFRLSRIIRPTLEEDTRAMERQDSIENQYSKVEQTEQSDSPSPLETPKNSSEKPKKRHRWLCFSVRSGFLRWLFIVELLLWIAMFLVATYYVILAE